jgi:Wiskott-Aldrich syndrome protein
MISQVVRAELKQQSAVFIPGLLPNSYSILAAASARVYHAQLSPKSAEWCYSRLRGTLLLGRDTVQVEDPQSVEAENHWFRLLDADSGKPVWMFRIHTGFSYQVDRPFFHVFQGRVSPASVIRAP